MRWWHCGWRVSVQGFQLGLVKKPHTFGFGSVPRGWNVYLCGLVLQQLLQCGMLHKHWAMESSWGVNHSNNSSFSYSNSSNVSSNSCWISLFRQMLELVVFKLRLLGWALTCPPNPVHKHVLTQRMFSKLRRFKCRELPFSGLLLQLKCQEDTAPMEEETKQKSRCGSLQWCISTLITHQTTILNGCIRNIRL